MPETIETKQGEIGVSRLFILGANDPEMSLIETLVTEAGDRVIHAMANGARVHGGNAYRADAPDTTVHDERVYRVECDWTGSDGAIVIDHHRPGDPGYGRAPESFFHASSIGQILALRYGHIEQPGDDGVWYTGEWLMDQHPEDDGDKSHLRIPIPMEFILTAAADHCLEAAYRGQCPGVTPAELLEFRVKQKAAYQGRPEDDVRNDIERARSILRSSVAGEWDEWGGFGYFPDDEYADFRDTGRIAELPEAAAIEGIPYIARVTEPGGRQKIVLQAVPQGSDLVKRFMAGDIVPGLTDHYGDPLRGFAGGYTQQSQPPGVA